MGPRVGMELLMSIFVAVTLTGCGATPPPATGASAKKVPTPSVKTSGRERGQGRDEAQSTPATASPPPGVPPLRAEARASSCPRRAAVALGDLHEDLTATRAALRSPGPSTVTIAGWGALTLVQTGDVLDRGDDEPEILALLTRLRTEAAAAGGQVVVLNGNHEFMNAAGDLRYVTQGGFEDYAAYADGTDAAAAQGLPPELRDAPAGVRGRFLAFRPGEPVAQELATRKVVAIVGDSVFTHGGVRERWAELGLDRINDQARRFLTEGGPMPEALRAPDGPVWDRTFSTDPTAEDCAELQRVLDGLGVKRMVVGHTVQRGGITSACDETIWRIDVGMSAHYGGEPAALEIDATGARPVTAAVAGG